MTEQKSYAVAYARVSTDDHDQNPESQLVAIRAWAKDRNIEILREYQDKATGTNDDREGLDAAYGFCKRNPQIAHLIVLDADRLSRNMDDAPRMIKDFNDLGVRITYVADENLDLTTKEGKLMNAMKSYGAQSYTDGHKLKVKAGLARAVQNGKKLGRPRITSEQVDMDILIGLVRSGKSLRQCESVFKVSRTTLRTMIRNSEYEDEYVNITKCRKYNGIDDKPIIINNNEE